jgi:hypothetical protein
MASLIVAGNTSGSVTISAPDVASTPTLTLPTVSGTILTTGSSGQSIPKAALPTGSVLQVVNAIYSTETTNSTTTFADTGLSASITPTSATSKILIIISHPSNYKSAGNASNSLGMQLVRGSTNIASFGRSLFFTATAINNWGSISYSYLDSPATTSATTYKTQFKNEDNNGALVAVNISNSPSTITLLEIAA